MFDACFLVIKFFVSGDRETCNKNHASKDYQDLITVYRMRRRNLLDRLINTIRLLVGSCSNCSIHGKCLKGFCECDIGWQGQSCDSRGL